MFNGKIHLQVVHFPLLWFVYQSVPNVEGCNDKKIQGLNTGQRGLMKPLIVHCVRRGIVGNGIMKWIKTHNCLRHFESFLRDTFHLQSGLKIWKWWLRNFRNSRPCHLKSYSPKNVKLPETNMAPRKETILPTVNFSGAFAVSFGGGRF